MKSKRVFLSIIISLLFFNFMGITNVKGASIDPNNPTLLPSSGLNYYTSWSPFNSSHYYQVQTSQSGWYLLGFNSSLYIDSLKFSTQSDYSATEFQHPTITNWHDGFVLWDHDNNIDKYVNITRDSFYGSGEYSAHIRKSEAISLNNFYEDSINKIKYSAYILGGSVFMDYYLGINFYEIQLIGGHTYEIGYDTSDSGSTTIAIPVIIFKESSGFLYWAYGGNNAEVVGGSNVAGINSFQPSSTGTYLIVSRQSDNNEFIPSEFHIYDTTENLWEEEPIINGYLPLLLVISVLMINFIIIKRSKYRIK